MENLTGKVSDGQLVPVLMPVALPETALLLSSTVPPERMPILLAPVTV